MKVRVQIAGYLIYAAGFGDREIELEEGATVESLLARVNLGKELPRLVTRGGVALSANDALRDGDRVMIAPFYSGG